MNTTLEQDLKQKKKNQIDVHTTTAVTDSSR